MRRWLLPILLFAGTASAQPPRVRQVALEEPIELAEGPEPECVDEVAAAAHPAPPARAISELSEASCVELLRARGVPFQRLSSRESDGVGIPIRLAGPVGGVTVEHRGGLELHEIVDCRLAVALLEWAPLLREAGFTAVGHYSMYRPHARVAGSGRPSGHARGLAIDVGRLEREDGAPLAILDDWEARERGADPCEGSFDESEDSARIRRVVCGAVERGLFQVVITPHHDRAHRNHVHLEVRPDVDWSYVR